MEVEDFDKPSDGYTHNYDDPYKVLAVRMVVKYRPPELKRIMSERAFFKRLVITEIRDSIEINNIYADCVEDILLRSNRRVYHRTELERLGEFYFDEIDLNILRRYIKAFCKKCHINL